MEDKVLVKHVGSDDRWGKPKDGSKDWAEYWENHILNDYKTYYFRLSSMHICPNCGRSYTDKNIRVGAHVKKVDEDDQNIYIVGTCNECNSRGKSKNSAPFYCERCALVPANKEKL